MISFSICRRQHFLSECTQLKKAVSCSTNRRSGVCLQILYTHTHTSTFFCVPLLYKAKSVKDTHAFLSIGFIFAHYLRKTSPQITDSNITITYIFNTLGKPASVKLHQYDLCILISESVITQSCVVTNHCTVCLLLYSFSSILVMSSRFKMKHFFEISHSVVNSLHPIPSIALS